MIKKLLFGFLLLSSLTFAKVQCHTLYLYSSDVLGENEEIDKKLNKFLGEVQQYGTITKIQIVRAGSTAHRVYVFTENNKINHKIG